MDKAPRIALIVGSPREGNSAQLASFIERGICQAGGTCEVFKISERHIEGCFDCGGCMETGVCVQHDDFPEFSTLLAASDALIIVSPVFFAGPPSQLKALFDRCQPYWVKRYVLGEPATQKKPAELVVVGGGGDPFGYEPLVTISKSALNVAGFGVDTVHDFIGFDRQIDDSLAQTRAVTLGADLVRRVSALENER